MRTRAKFQCLSVTDHGWNKTVKLNVVYSRKEGEENYDFTKATPNGNIEMTIDNPAALVIFKPQGYYYVDFSEAPHDPKTGFKHENLNPIAPEIIS